MDAGRGLPDSKKMGAGRQKPRPGPRDPHPSDRRSVLRVSSHVSENVTSLRSDMYMYFLLAYCIPQGLDPQPTIHERTKQPPIFVEPGFTSL